MVAVNTPSRGLRPIQFSRVLGRASSHAWPQLGWIGADPSRLLQPSVKPIVPVRQQRRTLDRSATGSLLFAKPLLQHAVPLRGPMFPLHTLLNGDYKG